MAHSGLGGAGDDRGGAVMLAAAMSVLEFTDAVSRVKEIMETSPRGWCGAPIIRGPREAARGAGTAAATGMVAVGRKARGITAVTPEGVALSCARRVCCTLGSVGGLPRNK